MDAGFALWLFGMSVGASALGGMLGMASGIFIVPILALFGGVALRTAIGASIVSVIACSCGSAASFLEGLWCKLAGTSKRSLLRRADVKPQAPRSRLQAQLGLERPDAPVRTVSCGCDASARCRRS